MRKTTEFFICAALCGAAFLTPPLSAAVKRVQNQLTADSMDYDIEKGAFKAEGHVTLSREGVTIISDKGTANTKTQNAQMRQNVHAFGTLNGEKLDARCDMLDADFKEEGDYAMRGNVDALFGTCTLRSATARLRGRTFEASQVTRFEDTAQKLVVACDAVSGSYDSEGITSGVATGKVNAVKTDKDKVSTLNCEKLVYSRADGTMTGTGSASISVDRVGESSVKPTKIECDTLFYNFRDGLVTGTGNASAVQEGRRVTAQTMIYHTDTGFLEAKGTPRMTVDLSSSGSSGNQKKSPAGKRSGK